MEPTLKPTTAPPLSLWKNKNMVLLWVGTLISSSGFQLYTIALPLFIYELTQSAQAMSTMRAVEFFPNVLLGVFLGAIVDRFRRKKIMSLMVIVQLAVILAIILLQTTYGLSMWQLYLFGFLLSSASYTLGNAQHSFIPTIVDKDQLTEVNAKFSLIQTVIGLIGPGAAGLLLTFVSFETGMGVYALCLGILFLCIQLLNVQELEKKKGKTSIWQDIKEGWDELFKNRMLLPPTIAITFMNLSSSLTIGLLIFFAVDQLGAQNSQLGLLLSMGGAGGIAASLAMGKFGKNVPRGRLFSITVLIDSISVFLMVLVQYWWMLGICLFVRTFAITTTNIVYFSIRQGFTPNHLLGRVAGTSSMLMKLATPGGLMLSGFLTGFMPIQAIFAMSAFITLTIFFVLQTKEFVRLK